MTDIPKPSETAIHWWAGIAAALTVIITSGRRIWDGTKAVWRWFVRRMNALPELTTALNELAAALKTQESRFGAMDTTLKEVHDKAILAHAQGQMILEQSNIAMWHCKLPEGICVWVNDAFANAFSMSKEEALNWGWTKAIHPDDTKQAISAWMDSVTTGRPYRARYRILVGDEPVTYESSGSIIRDVHGTPIAVFGQSVPLAAHA